MTEAPSRRPDRWVRAPSRLDTEELAERLRGLPGLRWWQRPLRFVAVAMLGLADAVVTIVGNWHLLMLTAIPAVWLGAISWQWRRVVLFDGDLPEVRGWAGVAAALVIVAATSASYWCNVTFALTVKNTGGGAIRAAFAEAQRRAAWIWTAAAATSSAHVVVAVWVVTTGESWFVAGLSAIAVLQMYAFVAVPVLIATGRPTRRSMKERARSAAASLGVSGLTCTPGVLISRVGVLLIGLGWFRLLGGALIVVGALLQVAGISSATAVKFAGRLVLPHTTGGPQ